MLPLVKIKSATELRQDPATHNTPLEIPIGLNVNLIDESLFGFKSFKDIFVREEEMRRVLELEM